MMENDTVVSSGVLYECGASSSSSSSSGGKEDDDMRLVPLLLTYLATGSRELSYGNVDVLSEIDATAYCPQCLDYRDAMSAVTKALGVCSNVDGGCRACPHCQSPLSVKIDNDTDTTRKYYHYCGYCRYQSPIHLVLDKSDTTTNVTKEINQQIMDQYQQISIHDTFRKLCDDYNNSNNNDMTPLVPVSEEETKIEDYAKNSSTTMYSSISTVVLTNSAEYYQKDDDSSSSSLLPYPLPLHTRKIRRCRKELAAGRTGILMKPKPNPLEGDSSLRSGHGQWWKKDSSAIHVVPKVDLWNHSLHRDEEGKAMLSFVLKIQNPTLTSVSLQLGCQNGQATAATTKVQNVILDPIHSTRVTSSIYQYSSTTTNNNNNDNEFFWTDVISLEAMEDAALREWKNTTTSDNNNNNNNNTTDNSTVINHETKAKLLSSHQDEAFTQFICPIDIDTFQNNKNDDADVTPTHFAVPLQMRILIQPGSWELPSYRASKTQTPTKEQEYVNFNLYVVCPYQNN